MQFGGNHFPLESAHQGLKLASRARSTSPICGQYNEQTYMTAIMLFKGLSVIGARVKKINWIMV